MSELERRLVALGAEIAWPETPRLALPAAAPARRARRRWGRTAALGLAVAVAVLGAVLAVSPSARSAFLELFRLRGATVTRVERLPAIVARGIDYGERVTRAEAERRVGFRLLALPGAPPDAVFVRADRAAALVYGDPARPRLVVLQLNGSVWPGFVEKVGGARMRVEQVVVDGEPGLFVSGEEHFVMFVDGTGDITDEQTYLAGTVLLLQRGPLLLRLEGDLTLDDAIALARSLR